MTTPSPRLGLTIPNEDGSDDADLAALLRSLGLDVENKAPGVTALTTAQRTALTGAAMFAGRVVYDTDEDTAYLGNGTSWRALPKLDASKNLPMAGKKITGLAAGTIAGEAVRYEQVTPVYAIGTRTSGSQTLSGTTKVSYPTEVDPSGILSNGTITLPSTGMWLVTGSVFSNTQQTGLGAEIYIDHANDGVAWQTWKDYAAAVSTLIHASASDTVQMYAIGSGSITAARLAVTKIGV